VVRTNLSRGSIAATIRREVHEIDKDLPVSDVVAMSDRMDASVAQPRFRTWLLGSFGVMALVLAAAGIFAVISYSVSRRTHEIGIRVTLGASPASVMRLVLAESVRLVLIGLGIGIPIALGLGRFISNLLYGVRAADPTTFTCVAFLLIAVGTLAAYLPARRAVRVDPLIALRYE
jgi:ABC-type antimicrobial peptide transport system permease subunit